MHRVLPFVAIVAAPAFAAADSTERQAFMSVMGGYSIAAPPEATEPEEFERGPLVGASLAWDRAPPEYVRIRGERVGRAELVPEATLQVTGRDGMLLGGVRMQVAVAEYEVGLFRVSNRGKVWLAPRGGVGTQATGAIWGGDVGLAFHTGGIDIGGWMGVYTWNQSVPLEQSGYMARQPLAPEATGSERILQLQLGLLLSTTSL